MTELEKIQSLLKSAEDKIKAQERNLYETKRAAQQTEDQAKALVAETEASIATAAQQMQVAHAVSLGLFGLAELGKAFLARKTAAARMTHREQTMCNPFQQFVDAYRNKDQIQIDSAIEKAKTIIASIKADGETSRAKSFEVAIALGFDKFEVIWERLVYES